MIKTTSRKVAPRKKMQGRPAEKIGSRRTTAVKLAAISPANANEAKPESEMIGDEAALQAESQVGGGDS